MVERHDMSRVATTGALAANAQLSAAEDEHVLSPPTGRKKSPSLLIPLFILSLAVPFTFFIGPARLSPYRMVLIALFVPCLIAWLSGACGKIRMPDVLILLYCIWAAIAMVINP